MLLNLQVIPMVLILVLNKLKSFLKYFGLSHCLILAACASSNNTKPIEHPSIIQDSAQTFVVPTFATDTLMQVALSNTGIHYYCPKSAFNQDTLDIALIFDPAAKGKRFIMDNKNIAIEQSMIFISVDGSRNGLKVADVQPMLLVVQMHIGKCSNKPYRLFGVGFSGGSRIASGIQSLENKFDGLLLCCAAPQANDLKCPVVLYTADEDMNFLEQLRYYNATSASNVVLQIEKGKHAWPRNEALAAMLKLLKKKKIGKQVINVSKTPIDQTIINQELSLQQEVVNSYFQKPIEWWKDFLSIQRSAKSALDKRVLNYTSLYSYSMSNNGEVINDLSALDYVLKIYEWADPTNNEWMYQRSIWYLRQKDEDNAWKHLELAIQNGFNQKDRLIQNVYWRNYQSDQKLNEYIAQMKADL
jgi:hypothetical protein